MFAQLGCFLCMTLSLCFLRVFVHSFSSCIFCLRVLRALCTLCVLPALFATPALSATLSQSFIERCEQKGKLYFSANFFKEKYKDIVLLNHFLETRSVLHFTLITLVISQLAFTFSKKQ